MCLAVATGMNECDQLPRPTIRFSLCHQDAFLQEVQIEEVLRGVLKDPPEADEVCFELSRHVHSDLSTLLHNPRGGLESALGHGWTQSYSVSESRPTVIGASNQPLHSIANRGGIDARN